MIFIENDYEMIVVQLFHNSLPKRLQNLHQSDPLKTLFQNLIKSSRMSSQRSPLTISLLVAHGTIQLNQFQVSSLSVPRSIQCPPMSKGSWRHFLKRS